MCVCACMRNWLDDREFVVRFPTDARDFSRAGCGAYEAFRLVDAGLYFPRGEHGRSV